MIINKLNLLLAERFIKASKLAKDTGIAQSTISKIVNNATSQIDYSTLDKICLYLKITPSDFFEYAPYQFVFKNFQNEGYTKDKKTAFFKFNIEISGEIFPVSFKGSIFDLNNPEGASVSLHPLGEKDMENLLFDFDKHLSISIKSSLSEEITSYISKNILDNLGIKKINKVDVDYFYLPF